MSVPNDFPIVQQVYANGHYDLTTKIGTGGQFLEPTAMALHAQNHRYGHLKKRAGQNQWNGHAVDNVLYLGDDGVATAIDIVASGESTSARLQWSPDLVNGRGRYTAADWLAPMPYAFTLPPHHCGLGASLFWLIGGWIQHREQVVRHLDEFRYVLGADYIRTVFCCTGVKAWALIGSDPKWPGFAQAVREAQAYCKSIDLRIAWTMVGENAGIPGGDWRALLNYASELIDDSYLDEMWNEYRLTGGNLATIKDMADHWRRMRPSARLALDTPHTAMAAPVGESSDPLPQEVTSMNYGSSANCQSPQWDRTQPNPRNMGPDVYDDWISHEPRGMGSSVAASNDWLPLSNDYIQTILAGGRDHTSHTKPGVWGGHCHPDFPAENDPPNVWDYADWPAVAQAHRDVREGRVPTGEGSTPMPVPAPPYDEQWIKNTVTPAIVECYTEAKVPLDSLYSVWIARTQFDVQPPNLLPQQESLAKHVRECRDALGLP